MVLLLDGGVGHEWKKAHGDASCSLPAFRAPISRTFLRKSSDPQAPSLKAHKSSLLPMDRTLEEYHVMMAHLSSSHVAG